MTYESFPVQSQFRDELLAQLAPHEVDVDEWSEEVLQAAAIQELANRNMELFLSFATTLGEVALKREGIDIAAEEALSTGRAEYEGLEIEVSDGNQ